ncbi:type II toxin-antitoxin system VapC family toxin [Specibacter cremeus]|uniref:type II toxin-antitoxin system VapC family toxin n=1 Tax=Specibacter cremeus TaxID=1629051 RepID=UPI0013DDBCD3|nr:PIN domain-containing protein [Specibacter cremeus]
MIVLDASVIIALLDGQDAFHEQSRRLLDALAGEEWVVNAMTLAEVMVGPARAGQLEAVSTAVDRMNLRTDPLDAASVPRLAQLRAATSLTVPDCCVLLTAEKLHCALATFDRRLAKAARARGVEVHE